MIQDSFDHFSFYFTNTRANQLHSFYLSFFLFSSRSVVHVCLLLFSQDLLLDLSTLNQHHHKCCSTAHIAPPPLGLPPTPSSPHSHPFLLLLPCFLYLGMLLLTPVVGNYSHQHPYFHHPPSPGHPPAPPSYPLCSESSTRAHDQACRGV